MRIVAAMALPALALLLAAHLRQSRMRNFRVAG